MIGRVLLPALTALAIGCGAGGQRCTPGQSIACACSDGRSGAQVCEGDGTYAACECGSVNGTGGHGGGDMGGGTPSVGGAKRVFVTSIAYAATAAPTVCQNAANAVGLGGTWKAWMAVNTTSPLPGILGSGPWQLITGETAFANSGQLGTTPSTAIDVTEMGTKLAAPDRYVWTGTLAGGTASGHDCADWTDNTNGWTGTIGDATQTATWTDVGSTQSCNYTAHVYCFEN